MLMQFSFLAGWGRDGGGGEGQTKSIMGDVQMRNLLHFYQLCRKQGLGRKIGGQVLR